MDNTTNAPEMVTQADRNLFRALFLSQTDMTIDEANRKLNEGQFDSDPAMKALARHRTEQSASPSGLVEASHQAVTALDAIDRSHDIHALAKARPLVEPALINLRAALTAAPATAGEGECPHKNTSFYADTSMVSVKCDACGKVLPQTPSASGEAIELLADLKKAVETGDERGWANTDFINIANIVLSGRATLFEALTQSPPPNDAVREALEPVWHWYQSDEHPERPLAEIVADVVADLQQDRAFVLNPPKHRYWMPGEPDCPREIKAGNGELHTLRCKVCGQDNPRDEICRLATPTASTTDNNLQKTQIAPVLCGKCKEVTDTAASTTGAIEAAREMLADNMTSESHHPGYVLVPTASFEKMRLAIKGMELNNDR